MHILKPAILPPITTILTSEYEKHLSFWRDCMCFKKLSGFESANSVTFSGLGIHLVINQAKSNDETFICGDQILYAMFPDELRKNLDRSKMVELTSCDNSEEAVFGILDPSGNLFKVRNRSELVRVQKLGILPFIFE